MNIKDIILDNRYNIIRKIGSGGMADVYLGEDALLGRPVAIKILHSNFANDEEFVARFKREAQAAGKLNHPNIVNMYDVGFDQGLHYIIMEYVDGKTLKEYIKEKGPLSIDEAVKFTIAIAEGLEHAHAMGIVHCDIKPHNVIITDNGRVKVTDFGIARAMNSTNTMMYTNSIMGSAHYLSPEQASGKSVDGSTDIYSLGVVLYEMLTGKVPFEGETPISVALKHVREKVTPPTRHNHSIPPLLEGVVLRALEKDPKDRFASITDMISDLRLSQGFTIGKTKRVEPYDFATQMIPTVNADTMEEFNTIDDDMSNEGKKKTMLNRIASIPQKYIVLSAAIIFLIAFLGAFLSYGNFWSNTTVEVPNVVGKQASVARNMLEDKRLRVSTSEVTNVDVPAGQVISQTPGAGEKVKEQRTIHLVVSKGVGDITVPDLSGLTADQARQRLKDIGLVVGKITQQPIEDKPNNIIISQSPSGDSKVAKGTAVDIVLSQTKAKKIKMPSLVGMTLKDARDVLGSHNLGVNQVDGSLEEKSVVLDQSVKAGEDIEEGSVVNLTTEFKEEKKKEEPKKEENRVKGTVDVTIPNGAKRQELRIVVKDDEGSVVVYDDAHKPGDRIVRNVSGVGNVRIEVYLDGALVQDTAL
ncbi:Stk1 family PASTA domain-containing Ser/Thr kinase [Veillonella agrestimuris]|uniref:Stk1 family PASTA domain-containing Ser/Thr kinase n=1 Tax=Veillonella agrestimuris TaxID=2941340 RepID=UPI00203B6350|nr:Stk1 family PASTA domain-containing Ser/Thr kinase [Veillonella agrestimuris]